jgi:hypothetical protein
MEIMADDWEHTRAHRYSKETPPPEWPAGVQSISLEGLALLGVEPATNELYWEGRKLVTEKKLAAYERWLATLATAATIVMAVVEVGRAAGVWH